MTEKEGTRSIGRTLRSAFSVALVCTLLAGLAGSTALVLVVRGFEQVTDLQVPLVAINDDLLRALTDAETSERGFLIPGDETFLHRYAPARPRFEQTLASAEALAGTPEITELFATQGEIGTAWLEEFADPIIELHRVDEDQAFALAQSGQGQRRLETFRPANARTEFASNDRLALRGRGRGPSPRSPGRSWSP